MKELVHAGGRSTAKQVNNIPVLGYQELSLGSASTLSPAGHPSTFLWNKDGEPKQSVAKGHHQ